MGDSVRDCPCDRSPKLGWGGSSRWSQGPSDDVFGHDRRLSFPDCAKATDLCDRSRQQLGKATSVSAREVISSPSKGVTYGTKPSSCKTTDSHRLGLVSHAHGRLLVRLRLRRPAVPGQNDNYGCLDRVGMGSYSRKVGSTWRSCFLRSLRMITVAPLPA